MKLNVTLNGQAAKRFQKIKSHYGYEADQSVVATLLIHEADRIEKGEC